MFLKPYRLAIANSKAEKLETLSVHKDYRPYLEINMYPDIPTPDGAQAYRYIVLSRAGLQADVIVPKSNGEVAMPQKRNKGVTLRGPYAPTLLEVSLS